MMTFTSQHGIGEQMSDQGPKPGLNMKRQNAAIKRFAPCFLYGAGEDVIAKRSYISHVTLDGSMIFTKYRPKSFCE